MWTPVWWQIYTDSLQLTMVIADILKPHTSTPNRGQRDLNTHHLEPQSKALPIKLYPHRIHIGTHYKYNTYCPNIIVFIATIINPDAFSAIFQGDNEVLCNIATKKYEGSFLPPTKTRKARRVTVFSCYPNTIFWRTFRRAILRVSIQKSFNITLFKLKLCGSLQIRRFFHRLYLSTFHEGIKCRTANIQPFQNFLGTEQSIIHILFPFLLFTSFTNLTILTRLTSSVILCKDSLYNDYKVNQGYLIDIVHNAKKFCNHRPETKPCSSTKGKQKSTDICQCSKNFLLTTNLLLIDWNPVTVDIA